MRKTLEELCAMKGVNGAFLLSEDGELIDFSAPPIYDREIISEAAATLSRATESISVQHTEWDTMVVHFEDSKLFIAKMENYTLCVIADSNLNLPFLNVALRVAKKKMLKRLSGQASSTMTPSSAYSGYSSQFSDAYSSQTPAPNTSSSQLMTGHSQSGFGSAVLPLTEKTSGIGGSAFAENSGMLWSGLGGTGMQSSAVAVADEASSKMLSRISEALAAIVGPMAKVFVKETVRKICRSEPFSMQYVRQLITELEQQHVTDDDDLQEFRNGLQD